LESTGTQYIDTNYYVQTENIKILADFTTKTISSERDLIGNQDTRTGRFVVGIYQYKFFGYSREYQSSETNVTTDAYSSTVDTKYNFEATYNLDSNEKTMVVNGKTYTATHTNSIKSTKPVQLFADGASTHMFGCKCYSIALYDGENLAFNLIPCYRKSDKVAGMYDAVSGQFYTNSGTGEFVTGPAVNRYDIDWSEDVGTVYGGYVDLVSGELVETWERRDMSEFSSIEKSSGAGEPWLHRFLLRHWVSGKGYCVKASNEILCDCLENATATADGTFQGTSMYIYDSTVSTVEEFKTKYAGHYIAYPFINDSFYTTHQLSPTTLSTLMFDNNFWSNADRIEIEYDYIGVFDPIESRKNIFTATPHTVTAKNSIISFGTDMAADLKECKVWFLPKQDLHGYDKPWIGGSGKNLLDQNNFEENNGAIVFGGTVSSSTPNGSIHLKAGTYTFSVNTTADVIAKNDDTGMVSSANSNLLTFTIEEEKDIRLFVIKNGSTTSLALYNYQLESGSSATSYEPYSNICPIEGWDSITMARVDRNLLDAENPDEDGFAYCHIPKGTVVVGSANYANKIRYYRKDKTQIDYWTMTWTSQYTPGRFYRSFTLKEDAYYWRCEYHNTTKGIELQLEYGSSPTPYDTSGTFITIPFPKTIYGGYVDLINGEIVETWKEYVYLNKTNLFNDLGNGYYEVGFGGVGGKGYGSSNNSMCSKLSYGYKKSSTLEIGYELDYVLLNQSNRFHTLIHSETPLTADTARQWFIDNNIQLVREVYSPTVYPIDPQTLTTLRGANTIWSNSNSDVEITYWKHNDDAYQHVPSSPITSNDNFIIVTDDGYAIGEEDDFIVY